MILKEVNFLNVIEALVKSGLTLEITFEDKLVAYLQGNLGKEIGFVKFSHINENYITVESRSGETDVALWSSSEGTDITPVKWELEEQLNKEFQEYFL